MAVAMKSAEFLLPSPVRKRAGETMMEKSGFSCVPGCPLFFHGCNCFPGFQVKPGAQPSFVCAPCSIKKIEDSGPGCTSHLLQRRADLIEDPGNGGGDGADAGDTAQCNQAEQQSVFHQVLTFFAVQKVIADHVQLQKRVLHRVLSMGNDSGCRRETCCTALPLPAR